MATGDRINVSYLRNRDYSSHIEWSYELNCDVFDCYKKAKSDPRIGYMKRLKSHWDELHPEYNHLNEKQLRQQATFVEKRKTVLSVNLETTAVEETAQNIGEGHNLEYTGENIQNNTYVEKHVDEVLLSDVKTRFLTHYNKYDKLLISEREYNSNVVYNISTDEWNAINRVIKEHLDLFKDPASLWNINVIQYSAVITLLERHNLLRERKNITTEKPVPNWQKHADEKVRNMQRKIAHINVILECDKNNIRLTKNQEKICKKLKRNYGNTKQEL